MNLTTLLTTEQATDNQPTPRQAKTGHGGLPVRTNLRAGNLLIGGDTQEKQYQPPTGPY